MGVCMCVMLSSEPIDAESTVHIKCESVAECSLFGTDD